MDGDMLTRWRQGRWGRKVDPVWLGAVLLVITGVALTGNRGLIGWTVASVAAVAAIALAAVQVVPREYPFSKNPRLIGALGALVVGIAFIFALVVKTDSGVAARARLRLVGRSAPAEVTSVYHEAHGGAAQSAQVTFRTYDNVLHTTGIELRDSTDRDIVVGSHLVVVYDPAHPDLAIPASALGVDPWRGDWFWLVSLAMVVVPSISFIAFTTRRPRRPIENVQTGAISPG
jgi:hypothetical protein